MSSLRFEQVKSVVLNNLNGSQLIGEGEYKFKCISLSLKLQTPYITLVDDSVDINVSTTAILGKAILGHAILGNSSSLPKLISPIIELVEEESKPKLQAPIIELVETNIPEEPVLIKLATPAIELVIVPESDDYWTVTNNLTNTTVANDITQVLKGNGYENNYLIDSGYKHSYHSLTIGGVENNGYISLSEEDSILSVNIPSNKLNGNITMTIIAEKVIHKLDTPVIRLEVIGEEEPELIKLATPFIELYEEVEYYTITKNLSNVSTEDTTTEVSADGSNDYVATFTVNEGYELKHYEALIGNVTNNNVFMFDEPNIYVEIPPKTLNGNVVITLTAEPIVYTVSKIFEGISEKDNTETATQIDGYSNTFTIYTGYKLKYYSLTIGGVTKSDCISLSPDNMTVYVNIAPSELTGDVVITLIAEVKLPKLATPNIELVSYYDGSVTVSAYDGTVPDMTYTDPSTVENAYDGSVEVSGPKIGTINYNQTNAWSSIPIYRNFEIGMTWEEFINSDYNEVQNDVSGNITVSGQFILSDNYVKFYGKRTTDTSYRMLSVLDSSGNNVNKTAEIKDGYNYRSYYSGSQEGGGSN